VTRPADSTLARTPFAARIKFVSAAEAGHFWD